MFDLLLQEINALTVSSQTIISHSLDKSSLVQLYRQNSDSVFFFCNFRYLPPECFELSKTPLISLKVYFSPSRTFSHSHSHGQCKEKGMMNTKILSQPQHPFRSSSSNSEPIPSLSQLATASEGQWLKGSRQLTYRSGKTLGIPSPHALFTLQL